MKINKLILFIIFLMGLNNMYAQDNPLIGMWNYIGNDGSLSSNGKMFLPDGHMYGYSYNQSRTDIGTWIMADYEVVNDSTYLEKCFFHSAITGQTDIEMTFYLSEDKQTLTTVFIYIYPNGQHVQTLETWQKDTAAEQKYMERVAQDWNVLHAKALKDFGRVPDEGETVEERGEKFYMAYQNALKQNNLDAAYEQILMRAELAPTNMQWQQDAVEFFIQLGIAPTNARKYAERYRNLAKAEAVNARDTTLQKSVLALAMLTNDMAEKYNVLENHLQEEEACNEPPTAYTMVLYFLVCSYGFQEKQYEAVYENAIQAIKVSNLFENKDVALLSNLYAIAANSKIQGTKDYETAISLLEQSIGSITTTSNSDGYRFAMLAMCYDKVIKRGNKEYDKKLKLLLKDKLWAIRFDEGQTNLPGGLKAGETYYILREGEWHIGDSRLPFDFDDIILGQATKTVTVLMNEKGEIFYNETEDGTDDFQVTLLLKEDNPVIHAMIQDAWKTYKKKGTL